MNMHMRCTCGAHAARPRLPRAVRVDSVAARREYEAVAPRGLEELRGCEFLLRLWRELHLQGRVRGRVEVRIRLLLRLWRELHVQRACQLGVGVEPVSADRHLAPSLPAILTAHLSVAAPRLEDISHASPLRVRVAHLHHEPRLLGLRQRAAQCEQAGGESLRGDD